MMKDNHRTKTVGCKMTEDEHALIESLAQRRVKSLSDWCREALITYASAEHSAKTDPAISQLWKRLALRTIFSTILFRIVNGHTLLDDQMSALIEKEDGSKRGRAQEMLKGTK